MRIVNTVAVVCLSVVAQVSVADDFPEQQGFSVQRVMQQGWYLHGELGSLIADSNEDEFLQRIDTAGINATILELEEDRFGWRGGVGYQLNDYFAVELSYMEVEEQELRIGGDTANFIAATAELSDVNPEYDDGAGLGVSLSYPFGDYWAVMARVGYHRWSGEELIDSESDAYYGLGIKHYFNERIAVNAQWQRFEMLNESGDFLSFGLHYYFSEQRPEPIAMLVEPKVPVVPIAIVEKKDTDMDGVFDESDQCPNTERGKEVNAQGCELLQAVTLQLAFFHDSAVIKEEDFAEVEKIAELLKQHPQGVAVIEGHSDNVGAPAYNVRLSKQRAAAVVDMLIEKFGIDPERLHSDGYGETRPIADNATFTGRRVNRRVEVVISRRAEDDSGASISE